jgi:hypothetical protein
MSSLCFDDFCENPPDEILPPLDRANSGAEVVLTPDALHWREHGYLVLPNLLPDAIVNAYRKAYLASGRCPWGWAESQPYLHVPEMLDLCCFPPLLKKIEELIPTPMGVNLALSGWATTSRTWHQDDYLNPPWLNSWYLAVWMALDDIDPDSGLFEYVPGSHRWPLMRGEKVRAILPPEERNSDSWPLHAERLVTPIFDEKIIESGLPIRAFHAKKGDVLLWHARLAHRGALAKKPGTLRPALLAHYSSIVRRTEMPVHRRHKDGEFYLVFQNP